MAGLGLVEDTYNLRARLAPCIVVFLPVMLAVASWWPGEAKWPGVLVGVGFSLALGTLLSQLGRDIGQAKQKKLFESWGGTPTTQLLSHSTSTLNPLTLKRYHEVLRLVRPELPIPRSKEHEETDKTGAAAAYSSCTDYLRELSRDKQKYPLVFEENVNFGFRRNLWGMKPTGVALAAIATAVCSYRAAMQFQATETVEPVTAISTVASLMLLVLWCLRIRPSWVRSAAFAYAERLLGICDTIAQPKPEQKIIS